MSGLRPTYRGIAITDYPGLLLVLAQLMADDSADSRAADSSYCAAARKDGSANGSGSGTDGRIFLLVGHSGTTAQAEQ